MAQYGPFPGVEVQFDLNGNPVDDNNHSLSVDAAAQPALDGIGAAGATDLIVISHGWNNDKKQARELYDGFFKTLKDLVDKNQVTIPADKKFFVIGVLWPSARFVDPSQIPGGAAGTTDTATDDIVAQLTVLRGAFEGNATAQAAIDDAIAAAPDIEADENARTAFVQALKALPSDDPEEHDTITTITEASANTDETELLQRLSALPVGTPVPTDADAGGAASLGSTLGTMFGGLKSGALALASVFTYKTMKERAGTVGRTGLAPVLGAIRKKFPNLNVHLAGHSFGARLVTSAANTPWTGNEATHQATTLALLQGAFSHFGFAVNYLASGKNGAFRDVIAKPAISRNAIITHSTHDMAVGWAYPAASLVLGQVASGVAALNPFGGMGADGAVTTPEAVFEDLNDVGTPYAALPAKIIVRNLRGDQFIAGHSDITGPQVVYAFMSNVL